VAVHDQLGPEGAHGGVLVRAVGVRDHDGDGGPQGPAGKGQALSMVAPRGGDEPSYRWAPVPEPGDVDQTAPYLERARGRMVFVLHPHLGTDVIGQQGPHVLRGRRDPAPYDLSRPVELFETDRHGYSIAPRLSCP